MRLLFVVLLAACAANPQPESATTGTLAGTSWRLVEFEGGDGTVLRPADRSRYTISFGTDGRVSVRLDCNQGSSTWTSPERSVLTLGALGLTKMYCGPVPLNDRFARDWEYVRTYTLQDGHLYLALMADGGIYEFEPI